MSGEYGLSRRRSRRNKSSIFRSALIDHLRACALFLEKAGRAATPEALHSMLNDAVEITHEWQEDEVLKEASVALEGREPIQIKALQAGSAWCFQTDDDAPDEALIQAANDGLLKVREALSSRGAVAQFGRLEIPGQARVIRLTGEARRLCSIEGCMKPARIGYVARNALRLIWRCDDHAAEPDDVLAQEKAT